MKTSNKILTATFLGCLLFGISVLGFVRMNTKEGVAISAEGKSTTRTITIDNEKGLQSLEVSNGVVKLHQTENENKIEVTCAENIHDYIAHHYKDGVAEIYIKPGSYNDIGSIEIDVYANNLENIEINGTVKLTNDDSFKTDFLNIVAQHSTSAILSIEANTLTIDSKDGANINLDGKVYVLKANAKNSGNINARNLEANEVYVEANDAGKLITNVKEKLSVDVSNAGEVLYRGEPTVIINSQTDAGKVTKL